MCGELSALGDAHPAEAARSVAGRETRNPCIEDGIARSRARVGEREAGQAGVQELALVQDGGGRQQAADVDHRGGAEDHSTGRAEPDVAPERAAYASDIAVDRPVDLHRAGGVQTVQHDVGAPGDGVVHRLAVGDGVTVPVDQSAAGVGRHGGGRPGGRDHRHLGGAACDLGRQRGLHRQGAGGSRRQTSARERPRERAPREKFGLAAAARPNGAGHVGCSSPAAVTGGRRSS